MNPSCQATWYDGRSAKRHEVTVHCDGSTVTVSGSGINRQFPLGEVRIAPGLGKMSRMLRFPDGACAETKAGAFLDDLRLRQGKGDLFGRIHRWEMNPVRAFYALLLTLLIVFCLVRFGLPTLAEKVAFALPATTEELIGRQTLQILDRFAMAPTRVSRDRQQQLSLLFREMAAGCPEGKGWRLEFRSSPLIGSNAFALPSGIVVVTDGMVQLARNDNEIAGILAHELGHLRRRHALRHLLQNSGTALVIAALTGDITSVSSFAPAMPTLLIDAKYSRDFEREADMNAVEYLKGKGIPVRSYAEILARLDAEHYKERDKAPRLGELFDDHPLMLERVRNIVAAGAGQVHD